MNQDIVQFFVFVALPIIATASISILLIDYRRRMRDRQSAAYMERRDEYRRQRSETMEDVILQLLTYMSHSGMALPAKLPKAVPNEFDQALQPLRYQYAYNGIAPYTLRTSSTAILKFTVMGMTIFRSASAEMITVTVEVPNQDFHWTGDISANFTLLNMFNNFEKLISKKEQPKDLSELLPKDAQWMTRLYHVNDAAMTKWLNGYSPEAPAKITPAEQLLALKRELSEVLLSN